jgi:hypothetical protein
MTIVSAFDVDDDEARSLQRCHTLAWNKRRKKKKKKGRQLLEFGGPSADAAKIVPTVGLPFVASGAAVVAEAADVEAVGQADKKKKKKKLKSRLAAVANFASATLGRSLGVHDSQAERERLRALAWSAEQFRRRTAEPPTANEISATAKAYLRETFRIQESILRISVSAENFSDQFL